jgi:hypothetical protein
MHKKRLFDFTGKNSYTRKIISGVVEGEISLKQGCPNTSGSRNAKFTFFGRSLEY